MTIWEEAVGYVTIGPGYYDSYWAVAKAAVELFNVDSWYSIRHDLRVEDTINWLQETHKEEIENIIIKRRLSK